MRFSGGDVESLHEEQDSGLEQLDLWVPLRGQIWMVHAIVFTSVFVQAVWMAVDLQKKGILSSSSGGNKRRKTKKRTEEMPHAQRGKKIEPTHLITTLTVIID